MDTLLLKENLQIKTISESFSQHFPKWKVTQKSKNKIIITKGVALLLVKVKGNKVKIGSDLNIRHSKIIIPLIIGILLGVLPVFIVITLLYIIYRKKRKTLKKQVLEHIASEFSE